MVDRMGQLIELLRSAQPGTIIIQAGKILAQIQGKQSQYLLDQGYLSPLGSEADQALFTYCRVIKEGNRSLPMRGLDIEASDPDSRQKRMDLAHVYIDLNTKTAVAEKREKKEKSSDPEMERETRPLSALEAALQNKWMVLLGDPGSGKTTFINHLTLCLAAHRMEPHGDWLTRLSGWSAEEADLFPIQVTLRDFAQWSYTCDLKADPCHLWNFIVTRFEAQNLKSARHPLEQALEKGRAILLLDGLDEIPDKDRVSFVRNAILSFAIRHPDTRIIVTCRVLSYQDNRLEDFTIFELAPFDEERMHRFIQAWYNELEWLGTIKRDQTERYKKGLEDSLNRPDIRELAPNPLLLTVMALVNTHKGQLPDARAMLYEEAVDILLWRWDQHKAVGEGKSLPRLREFLSQAGKTDIDLKRVLWDLAFQTQEKGNAGKEGAKADIHEWDLQKALVELHPQKSLDWTTNVIETIKLRAGLLVERETGTYTFPHRTFQEFLAASHLSIQTDYAKRASDLAKDGPFWRQVILLSAGLLFYVKGELEKTIVLLSELLPGDLKDEKGAWYQAWLAGDVILEIGVNRIEKMELGRELINRIRGRLVEILKSGQLEPKERVSAGDTLARLGDPRFRADAWYLPDDPMLGFVEVPEGTFWMGSEPESDKEADARETPQHQILRPTYYMSRYPVTVAQYDLFFRDGGYGNESYWKEAKRIGVWESGKIKDRWSDNFHQGPHDYGFPFNLPNHPLVGISWHEALAYCRWLTVQLKNKLSISEQITELVKSDAWEIRLPTESEWEKAARGTDRRIYPWGNQIEPNLANYKNTGIGATSAVGCFPKGASPFGCLDMAGNVYEWCLTKWRENYKKKEDNNLSGDESRVLREGAYNDYPGGLRSAYRSWSLPDGWSNLVGFRIVLSPSGI